MTYVVSAATCRSLLESRPAFAMRRDEHDARGVPPVRERNLRRSRRAERRGDSWNHLEFDPRRAQRFHFLARAAEQQRIAALEPRDDFPFARQLHHQRIDLGLRNSFRAATLSDVHHLRGRRKDAQKFLRHEIIVQHDVGRLQHAPRFARQQFRVARSRAHEINFFRHFADCSNLFSQWHRLQPVGFSPCNV